jgi:tRNA A-37 threonylcarbamoyl transferase component Bud32
MSALPTIDGYRIERCIGQGGAASVYLARGTDGRDVAIKVLERRALDDEARFHREVGALRAVKHPGIVEVFDAGQLEDGRPYLIMEYLEGRSLREEIAARGKRPLEEAWRIARAVAEALSAAHERGIVHRDLKPDNVFLQGDKARLLDFGLAKLVNEGDLPMQLTRSGTPMGTPPYMAPEQWWSAGVDARTDQYAFGVLLFEMLSGRVPFDTTVFADLVQCHLHERPPSLREAGVSTPDEMEALVARALAKSQDGRFASMRALMDAGDALFARKPKASFGRWLGLHGAIVAAGIALLIAVGYSGEARRSLYEWQRLGGTPQQLTTLFWVLGAVGLVIVARRRLRGGRAGVVAWWLALLPAISGAVGTYTGWRVAERTLARPGNHGLLVANEGMYEANLDRFLGFALASILCAALAAMPGPKTATASRRESAAALAALALVALVSLAAGAPSGVFIAGIAALSLVSSARDLERAVARVVAVGLAIAVGFARIEAREASLWSSGATRAERAAEIVLAAGERHGTTLAALMTVGILVAVEAIHIRRLRARARASFVALAALLALGAALDVALHRHFEQVVAGLRDELAPQFTLFARLDPPSGDALTPAKYPPHSAPALQIARGVVAVDAKPVAPTPALASVDGRLSVSGELNRALAARVAKDGGVHDVDLAVMIDRQVEFPVVLKLLAIARAAGVQRIEFLLTRGPPPVLAAGAPPETAFVLPTDFVALPAVLDDAGFSADDGSTFGALAPRLIDALAARGGAVPIRVP